MAIDSEGRPIPVFVPDPATMAPPMPPPPASEMIEQMKLVHKKADEGLRAASEIAGRMAALEKKVDSQLLDKIGEFERRFDELMLSRMQALMAQFDALRNSLTQRPEPMVSEAHPSHRAIAEHEHEHPAAGPSPPGAPKQGG